MPGPMVDVITACFMYVPLADAGLRRMIISIRAFKFPARASTLNEVLPIGA
jgi:hypothetical protein